MEVIGTAGARTKGDGGELQSRGKMGDGEWEGNGRLGFTLPSFKNRGDMGCGISYAHLPHYPAMLACINCTGNTNRRPTTVEDLSRGPRLAKLGLW